MTKWIGDNDNGRYEADSDPPVAQGLEQLANDNVAALRIAADQLKSPVAIEAHRKLLAFASKRDERGLRSPFFDVVEHILETEILESERTIA